MPHSVMKVLTVLAAGEWDNIYYPVDSIEVCLEEYRDGQFLRSAVLDTTTAVPKNEGDFHNPKQLLYASTSVATSWRRTISPAVT